VRVRIPPNLRWLASLGLVLAVTGAIELLKPHVPVLGLSVLYLLAVLPAAVFWGLAYAVGVSIASMLAFNFFFLPPLYTFTLSESRNWLALMVFLVTSVVVSELAAGSRRRAQESELLAGIAASLLERGSVRGELENIAAEAARALQVERVEIELPGEPPDPAATAERYALTVAGRSVGAIALEGERHGSDSARRRLLPALASMLGIAVDRERLQEEALAAEALRRSDAIKTAVLRAVSHDLRSPLMAITTSAGALARADLSIDDDDRRELLETILAEADRLDRLVSNLLDLSRLQAEAVKPEPELLALDDLVIRALAELGEDGVRVDLSTPEDSPTVEVDAHQIERVLVNLIENALKYSPAEERVSVQVTSTPSEAVVRVVDRGPGIPAGELEQIFEPFQRGAAGLGARGAGLGLAIAKGFAEANGCRVWAESRPGQGSSFVLALPAVAAPAGINA
jgi:two-component system sensor histidine kinase KdpD